LNVELKREEGKSRLGKKRQIFQHQTEFQHNRKRDVTSVGPFGNNRFTDRTRFCGSIDTIDPKPAELSRRPKLLP